MLYPISDKRLANHLCLRRAKERKTINENFYYGGETRVCPRHHFLYAVHDLQNRSRELRRKRKALERKMKTNRGERGHMR
jgi:hypothetical protein